MHEVHFHVKAKNEMLFFLYLDMCVLLEPLLSYCKTFLQGIWSAI